VNVTYHMSRISLAVAYQKICKKIAYFTTLTALEFWLAAAQYDARILCDGTHTRVVATFCK